MEPTAQSVRDHYAQQFDGLAADSHITSLAPRRLTGAQLHMRLKELDTMRNKIREEWGSFPVTGENLQALENSHTWELNEDGDGMLPSNLLQVYGREVDEYDQANDKLRQETQSGVQFGEEIVEVDEHGNMLRKSSDRAALWPRIRYIGNYIKNHAKPVREVEAWSIVPPETKPRNQQVVDRLANRFSRAGKWNDLPLAVYGGPDFIRDNDYLTAADGTHRITAADLADVKVPVVGAHPYNRAEPADPMWAKIGDMIIGYDALTTRPTGKIQGGSKNGLLMDLEEVENEGIRLGLWQEQDLLRKSSGRRKSKYFPNIEDAAHGTQYFHGHARWFPKFSDKALVERKNYADEGFLDEVYQSGRGHYFSANPEDAKEWAGGDEIYKPVKWGQTAPVSRTFLTRARLNVNNPLVFDDEMSDFAGVPKLDEMNRGEVSQFIHGIVSERGMPRENLLRGGFHSNLTQDDIHDVVSMDIRENSPTSLQQAMNFALTPDGITALARSRGNDSVISASGIVGTMPGRRELAVFDADKIKLVRTNQFHKSSGKAQLWAGERPVRHGGNESLRFEYMMNTDDSAVGSAYAMVRPYYTAAYPYEQMVISPHFPGVAESHKQLSMPFTNRVVRDMLRRVPEGTQLDTNTTVSTLNGARLFNLFQRKLGGGKPMYEGTRENIQHLKNIDPRYMEAEYPKESRINFHNRPQAFFRDFPDAELLGEFPIVGKSSGKTIINGVPYGIYSYADGSEHSFGDVLRPARMRTWENIVRQNPKSREVSRDFIRNAIPKDGEGAGFESSMLTSILNDDDGEFAEGKVDWQDLMQTFANVSPGATIKAEDVAYPNYVGSDSLEHVYDRVYYPSEFSIDDSEAKPHAYTDAIGYVRREMDDADKPSVIATANIQSPVAQSHRYADMKVDDYTDYEPAVLDGASELVGAWQPTLLRAELDDAAIRGVKRYLIGTGNTVNTAAQSGAIRRAEMDGFEWDQVDDGGFHIPDGVRKLYDTIIPRNLKAMGARVKPVTFEGNSFHEVELEPWRELREGQGWLTAAGGKPFKKSSRKAQLWYGQSQDGYDDDEVMMNYLLSAGDDNNANTLGSAFAIVHQNPRGKLLVQPHLQGVSAEHQELAVPFVRRVLRDMSRRAPAEASMDLNTRVTGDEGVRMFNMLARMRGDASRISAPPITFSRAASPYPSQDYLNSAQPSGHFFADHPDAELMAEFPIVGKSSGKIKIKQAASHFPGANWIDRDDKFKHTMGLSTTREVEPRLWRVGDTLGLNSQELKRLTRSKLADKEQIGSHNLDAGLYNTAGKLGVTDIYLTDSPYGYFSYDWHKDLSGTKRITGRTMTVPDFGGDPHNPKVNYDSLHDYWFKDVPQDALAPYAVHTMLHELGHAMHTPDKVTRTNFMGSSKNNFHTAVREYVAERAGGQLGDKLGIPRPTGAARQFRNRLNESKYAQLLNAGFAGKLPTKVPVSMFATAMLSRPFDANQGLAELTDSHERGNYVRRTQGQWFKAGDWQKDGSLFVRKSNSRAKQLTAASHQPEVERYRDFANQEELWNSTYRAGLTNKPFYERLAGHAANLQREARMFKLKDAKQSIPFYMERAAELITQTPADKADRVMVSHINQASNASAEAKRKASGGLNELQATVWRTSPGYNAWSKGKRREWESTESWEGANRVAVDAQMESVARVLRSNGWQPQHSSPAYRVDWTGKLKPVKRVGSRYFVSPDGQREVRVSDHELPGGDAKAYAEHGVTGKGWEHYIFETDDAKVDPKRLADYIMSGEGQSKAWRESRKQDVEKSSGKVKPVWPRIARVGRVMNLMSPHDVVSPHNILQANETPNQNIVDRLASTFSRKGWNLPPIPVRAHEPDWPDNSDGYYNAVEGSHRIRAARMADVDVPIVAYVEEDYRAPRERGGVSWGHNGAYDAGDAALLWSQLTGRTGPDMGTRPLVSPENMGPLINHLEQLTLNMGLTDASTFEKSSSKYVPKEIAAAYGGGQWTWQETSMAQSLANKARDDALKQGLPEMSQQQAYRQALDTFNATHGKRPIRWDSDGDDFDYEDEPETYLPAPKALRGVHRFMRDPSDTSKLRTWYHGVRTHDDVDLSDLHSGWFSGDEGEAQSFADSDGTGKVLQAHILSRKPLQWHTALTQIQSAEDVDAFKYGDLPFTRKFAGDWADTMEHLTMGGEEDITEILGEFNSMDAIAPVLSQHNYDSLVIPGGNDRWVATVPGLTEVLDPRDHSKYTVESPQGANGGISLLLDKRCVTSSLDALCRLRTSYRLTMQAKQLCCNV